MAEKTLLEQFDVAAPGGSTFVKSGDDAMRTKWRAVAERMIKGGHQWEDSDGASIEQNAGKHICGVQGDPAVTGEIDLVFEEDGDVLIHCADDTGSPASTVTIGDGLAGSRPYKLIANELQGERQTTLNIPLPVSTVDRVAGLYIVNAGGGPMTLLGAWLYLGTAASSGDTTVDLLKYADITAGPDMSTGGDSAFSVLPTVAATARWGTAGTLVSGSHEVLEEFAAYAINVTALGTGAAAVQLILKVKRTGIT